MREEEEDEGSFLGANKLPPAFCVFLRHKHTLVSVISPTTDEKNIVEVAESHSHSRHIVVVVALRGTNHT